MCIRDSFWAYIQCTKTDGAASGRCINPKDNGFRLAVLIAVIFTVVALLFSPMALAISLLIEVVSYAIYTKPLPGKKEGRNV